MTLDDLELFRVLAERQSITDAARAVRVSQPTASRRIKALEDEMGAPLIERSTHPLTLTPFGIVFLDFADEVLQKYQALKFDATTPPGIAGTLTVATSSSPAARLVTRWMADFVKANPGVHLRMAEMNSREVAARVLDGEAELGFMGIRSSDASLTTLGMGEDDIVLIVPRVSPFSSLPRPALWETLHALPFVVRRVGSGTQGMVDAAIRERNWPPIGHVTLEVDTGSALIDAVESGLGAGFVSRELLFRRELTRSTVWPVKNLRIARPLYLVFHRDRIDHQPTARAFLRFANGRLLQQPASPKTQEEEFSR